jgi:WD40 repeat protein
MPFFAVLFLFSVSNAEEAIFQTGHTQYIGVHFSPNDELLVSSSAYDGRLILWDVKSGRQIWSRETRFIGNDSLLKEFYWSEDGKTIVTKSRNGAYQTWDAQTGKVLALTETKPEIKLIAPNKKLVSYREDNKNIIVFENGETKQFK